MERKFKDMTEQAFEEIINMLKPRLGKFLRRMGISVADIEDVEQEVFLRLHRKADGLEPEAIIPWAYTIARNERNRWLARSGRVFCTLRIEPMASSPSPEILIQDQDTREELQNRVADLPEKLHEALVLKHFQNLTFAQTALVLNLPEGTVKARVYEALCRLKRRMK